MCENNKQTDSINVLSCCECVDADTEVLSVKGFKRYNELKEKSLIYTWNDGMLELNPVKKIVAKQYENILHSYSVGHYNQVITPNHRMIVKRQNTDKYIIKCSDDVFKSKNIYELPVKFIGSTLKDADVSDDNIIRTAGNGCYSDKYQMFSMRQAKLFLDNWNDVSKKEGYQTGYICSNEETATQMQHIALIAGYASYIVFGDNRCYVLIRNKESVIPEIKKEIEYKGIVWCPSVENGTAVFRRHGNVFISGQAIVC